MRSKQQASSQQQGGCTALVSQGESENLEFKRSTHHTGAVEVWGRGTNRVIAMCRKHGAAPPVFEEGQGFLTVTFKAQMVAAGAIETPPTGQVTAQVSAQVTAQVAAQVLTFCREPKPAKAIMAELGLKHWKTFQNNYLNPLLEQGWSERTIPDKPQSRLQKYRLTVKGKKMIAKPGKQTGDK